MMRKNYFVFLAIMMSLMLGLVGCGRAQNTSSADKTSENALPESVNASSDETQDSTNTSSEDNDGVGEKVETENITQKDAYYQELSDAVDRAMLDIVERAVENKDIGSKIADNSRVNYLSETTLLLKDIKTILLYQTLNGRHYHSYDNSLYDMPHLKEILSDE